MRAYGGTRVVKQFSGNFWWATADYYARLEASQPMAKDYLGATAGEKSITSLLTRNITYIKILTTSGPWSCHTPTCEPGPKPLGANSVAATFTRSHT